jgi:hypothetical protein
MTTTAARRKQAPDRDDRPRSRPTIRLLVGLRVAAALVAGGVVLAQWWQSRSQPSAQDRAEDALTLQALAGSASEADGLIAEVRAADPADAAAIEDLAVRLQIVAVGMAELAEQANDEELRAAAGDAAEAYLDVGVGLATGSSVRTQRGVEGIAEAQQLLADYLGVEPGGSPTP